MSEFSGNKKDERNTKRKIIKRSKGKGKGKGKGKKEERRQDGKMVGDIRKGQYRRFPLGWIAGFRNESIALEGTYDTHCCGIHRLQHASIRGGDLRYDSKFMYYSSLVCYWGTEL